MKKMFISVIALAMSMMAMATETAYVQIRLTGINGGVSNSVYLTEDNAYTNAYESGADVEKIMSQANSNSVLMYAFVGTTPCGEVVALNLDGLNLGMMTNEVDNEYKLTFKNVSGRALTLYDRVANQVTNIVDNGVYNFSVDPSLVGQHAINDRFFINMDASDFNISLTTNDYGWATYSNTTDLQVLAPAGLKIYTGAFDGDHTLNLNEVNYVKANEGVVVYGTPNTTYYFAAGGSGAYGTNNLKPSSAYTVGDQNVYVLKGENLLLYNGITPLAANKAYLQLSAASSPKPAIRMVINHTTGVENVAVEDVKAEKFVENGEILIRRGNEVYNLQGQIVR